MIEYIHSDTNTSTHAYTHVQYTYRHIQRLRDKHTHTHIDKHTLNTSSMYNIVNVLKPV